MDEWAKKIECAALFVRVSVLTPFHILNNHPQQTPQQQVERISQMVLSKEGEAVIESLQKFQCLRCQRCVPGGGAGGNVHAEDE